jgi:glycerol-3-phosphate dehydrogenase
MLPGAGVDDRDASDPVTHAICHEMAHTLTDVVVRRMGLGAAGDPGDTIANQVASRMQAALGWSQERKQREIEALRSFYNVV